MPLPQYDASGNVIPVIDTISQSEPQPLLIPIESTTRVGTYGFNGVVNILSSLNVANDITQSEGYAYLDAVQIKGGLRVLNGTTTIVDKLIVNDTMTLNSGLHVQQGLTTLDEGLTVTETALFNNDVNVKGNLYTPGPQNLMYKLDDVQLYYPKMHHLINIDASTASVAETIYADTGSLGGQGDGGISKINYYEYNFINTTYSDTIPTLTLPALGDLAAGMELRFVNTGPYHPITLSCTGVNFNINGTIVESSYILDGTWNQVSFIYLPNSDDLSNIAIPPGEWSYGWYQTSYQ